MTEEPKREFKGVWIPATIWRSKDLTWFQKCLLAEIDSLTSETKGYCWASNKHLAENMGTSESYIANELSELRKKKLVMNMSFDGRQRHLIIAKNAMSNPPKPSHIGEEGFTQGLSQGSYIGEGRVNTQVNKDTSIDTSLDTKLDRLSICKQIIAYLNSKVSTDFRLGDSIRKIIEARLAEVDDDLEGIKKMIDRQVALWGHDPKMSNYLRPGTLFRASNFSGYYGMRNVPVNGSAKKVRVDHSLGF